MRSGCPISWARGSCIKRPSIPDRIGILKLLVFEESRKPEYPEKNISEQRWESTTNSTHIWHGPRESNPGHIGRRRVISPLSLNPVPCDIGKSSNSLKMRYNYAQKRNNLARFQNKQNSNLGCWIIIVKQWLAFK